MKRFLLFLLFPIAVGLAAETGRISGRVVDAATGLGLPQASVVVQGQVLGAATDANGYYVVLNVPVGTYRVEASMIGYRKVTVTDVLVESDRTAHASFRLAQTTVEMPGVEVRSERPMVSKEMVAARYAVRADQIQFMPGDRLSELVAFSTGVARTESTFHVRGGRSKEVDYLIDGVSVVDPMNGEFGIELARGVADEVIFMPGGFSAEYGRAMSGVINMITVNPKTNLSAGYRGKTEEFMPKYYDFGFTDQGVQVHLPASRALRAVFNLGVSTTDDWDPRLFMLPHKGRTDYSLYGKAFAELSGQLKASFSGALFRTQFDRYLSEWWLKLDDYRSDIRRGNLAVGKLTYMPNTRSFYGLTVSRFHTDKTYGVREPGGMEFWQDVTFRDTSEYEVPGMDINNPWGMPYENYWRFITYGTFEDYRRTSTDVWNAKLTGNSQLGRNHQLTMGVTGDLYGLASERVRWPAFNPVIDTYRFEPTRVAAYLQDRIDYEGLYADIGVRYDRFDPAASYFDSTYEIAPGELDTVWTPASVKQQLSPRLGISFRITDWLFARANYGHYFQVPWFEVLYDNTVRPVRYRTSYGDSAQLVLGNPDLKPERTQSYEVGLQGEVADGVLVTTNLWRKDVYDLLRTVLVPSRPEAYWTFDNVDYAKLTGVEFIFELRQEWIATKLSYTLSYARGTSSYANEAYFEFLQRGDTAPMKEYTLDFDQRNRFFLQLDMQWPEEGAGAGWLDRVMDRTALHAIGYLGNGFPYTTPEEKRDPKTWNQHLSPWRSNVDLVATKGLSLGPVEVDLVAEVLNVLDIRDILYVYPTSGKPNEDYLDPQRADPLFSRTGAQAMRFMDPDYDPRRDLNHDGYLTQYEEYISTWRYHRATIDWINNYGPPRRVRLGIEVGW